MTQAFRAIYLLSISLMMGGMVFFSFLVPPVLFRNFPMEEAGKVLSVIFPGYHIFSMTFSGLAFISLLLVSWLERKWNRFRFIFLVPLLAMSLYAGFVTGPTAMDLRNTIQLQKEKGTASMELKNEFHHYHRQAVILNGAILILGAILLLEVGARAKI